MEYSFVKMLPICHPSSHIYLQFVLAESDVCFLKPVKATNFKFKFLLNISKLIGDASSWYLIYNPTLQELLVFHQILLRCFAWPSLTRCPGVRYWYNELSRLFLHVLSKLPNLCKKKLQNHTFFLFWMVFLGLLIKYFSLITVL